MQLINIPSEKCPHCGRHEIPASSPRTIYECGSSDYDQRPGSFIKGDDCEQKTFTDGDLVIICDGSDAQGDKGTILWTQENGIILVELDDGVCWPVTESDIKPCR